ncbi:hypothetical protein G6O67_008667 [Ophiocordyceps sinensis]|uniref:Uncharacterized protein n=2 Tax=Ophiocordyceps sinensis TaxID=72228 RepID=A0A8H4LQE1_9HYPO|nr:multicopper oxidase [Ophiocordyceps sinensis CO18]KAF4504048.1 hypothetical protein G6O67_008667 [Ophiocordyceps sinensis]
MLNLLFLVALSLLHGGAAAHDLNSAAPDLNSAWPPDTPCPGNTPRTRSRWCRYSIDTDYTRHTPDTGVTREYFLELTDVVVALDGVPRPAMAVNGAIPGPTIFADWGDTVVVHVKNSLHRSGNGTSIHFHGIRQLFSNQNDGVVSITQCPTAPGRSITYTWKALQYGSSWYHSHFGLQTWEGVYGGIVINGPATANYDEDLGSLLLSDWSHTTVDEFSARDRGHLLPPLMDSGLLNGTNVFRNGGRWLNVRLKPGRSYRLRLVNAAVNTHFKFSIDHHVLKVIAADFVPIVPYETGKVDITMGQRYDIVITADQGAIASNFWMRAVPQALCSANRNAFNIRGIVHYDERPSTPRTLGRLDPPTCHDESMNDLVPHIRKDVGRADLETLETVAVRRDGPIFLWTLNSTSMRVEWDNPTIGKVLNKEGFRESNAIIELPNANELFYMVIQTHLPIPHPIHLHGHDFYVLAQGLGPFRRELVRLNRRNPTRRDTANLPASGYLVLAWETDNPGAWLMHCHIGFHKSDGFALQFIERASEMAEITDARSLENGCASWASFQSRRFIEQDDSGV